MEMVFSPPAKDSPGYLRRARTALELQEAMKSPTIEALDRLVDFLAQYVTEPADREQAREALFDASEEQLMGLLETVGGAEANPPSD